MKSFLRVVVSLVLLGTISSAFGDWGQIRHDFTNAKSRDEAVEKVKSNGENLDPDLNDLIGDYQSASTKEAKDSTFKDIGNLIESHATSEQFQRVTGNVELAKKIKSDPLYKGEREAPSANWLQKLLSRLEKMFNNNGSANNTKPPEIPSWVAGLVRVLFYTFCAVVVAALIYLVMKIPWGGASSRKGKGKRSGLLEEGEELLSEDQYLMDADRLIAEGRFREACRALYLASLLRIDAARIARFEPTQTNWEHLYRIETSKTRPPGLEFRLVTKAFDLAWYGFRANSAADVDIFRTTYLAIKQFTEAKHS